MALSLKNITKEAAVKAPRIAIWGVEKIGKTTFAASAPNPIFLPIAGEEGLDGIEVARFPVLRTYAEVVEALGVLAKEDHQYETLAIDSVTTMERLVWQHTCELGKKSSIEEFGYGKGYVEALKHWQALLDGLDYLRNEKSMTCIMIGHVKAKTFNDPLAEPYDKYVPAIDERAHLAINRWADSILFAAPKLGTRVVEKDERAGDTRRGMQVRERVLYTQGRPQHPGGGRHVYGRLPYELDLSWEAFSQAVSQAMSAERK